MFYKTIRAILWVIFKIVFRFRRVGQDNIPATGPVIIAANHVSYLDPIVMALASSRPVYFMAKADLFRKPVLGTTIHMLNAFPVRRDKADLDAFRAALRVLHRGEVLGLFPEGTRIRTGRLGTGLPGVARLALKEGIPVVPLAIKGTLHAFPGKRVRAIVGNPLLPEPKGNTKQSSEQFTSVIMTAISGLLDRDEEK